MSDYNFTLTNPTVSAFFERKTEDAPVTEFLYVHRNFLPVNFVSEIEVILLKTAEAIPNMNLSDGVKLRIDALSARYGELFSSLTECKSETKSKDVARSLLFVLRDILGICRNLTSKLEKTLKKK